MNWDHTKESARRKHFKRCPKCGEVGRLSLYTPAKGSPSAMIAHKGHVEMGMFNMIDESCNFSYDECIEMGLRK